MDEPFTSEGLFVCGKNVMEAFVPRKPKKPCAHPGCPNLTDTRYCEEHRYEEKGAYEKTGGNPFYSSSEWRRKRREYLKEHPFCVRCGRPAVIVDHIVPIRKGGEPLDDGNLQSLCWPCHSRKSVEEGSRYGRKVYTY